MFENRSDKRFSVDCYLVSPEAIHSTKDAVYWGNAASRMIASCKSMISTMEEYQKLVYARVQEIESATWHPNVTLKRDKSWVTGKVSYILTVSMVCNTPGIKPRELERTVYPGTERHKAIAAWKAYQKTHPGIEAILEIEKGKWEK